MRIQRIEVYHIAMPLVYPFRTAYGDEHCIEGALVRMVGAEGWGWGEATPGREPIYSNECAGAMFRVLCDNLAPRLIGQEIESGRQLQAALSAIKGNYFAKGSLDLGVPGRDPKVGRMAGSQPDRAVYRSPGSKPQPMSLSGLAPDLASGASTPHNR